MSNLDYLSLAIPGLVIFFLLGLIIYPVRKDSGNYPDFRTKTISKSRKIMGDIFIALSALCVVAIFLLWPLVQFGIICVEGSSC